MEVIIMGNTIDHEDTARLILMDMPNPSFMDFVKQMREHYPNFDLHLSKDLYTKYMGFDGRQHPTHNLETGERL
jgi:hypothetical protein